MISKLKHIILTLCFFALGSNSFCYAQSQQFFKKINRTHGLSDNRINCIEKEKNGFVWIGTKNGLNRYDGYQVKVYNNRNSNIPNNDISDILIDSKGNIWVATLGGGLALYNPRQDDFTVYKTIPENNSSIPSNQLNSIFEDSSGNLWIGMNNGFCMFNRQTNLFKSFNLKKTKSVTSFFEDENKNLWIGTFGSGLYYFNTKTQSFNSVETGSNIVNNDFIYTLLLLNKNELLIGTRGSGLLTLNLNTLLYRDYLKENLNIHHNVSIIRSLTRDSNDNIWVGTDGNGIFKIEKPNSKNRITSNYLNNTQIQSSLSGNAVYEVIEDDENNIWVGTAWNGVNTLDINNSFEILFSDVKGIDPSPVLSIFKDQDKFFLGLDGKGLTIFDKESTLYYNKESDRYIGGNYIQHIMKSRNGAFWIGTFANGLIKFNEEKGTFKQYTHQPNNENSLSYNDVRYIIEDENNNLWIATWEGGLNFFDTKNETFKHFKKTDNTGTSISSDNVISLQKDGNNIWISTFGGGINHFDITTQEFTHFRYEKENTNSISSDNTYALFKDSKENLWIGTSGNGINQYDSKTNTFKRFNDKETIQYNTITAIIEDDNGMIWFSSKEGIFNYDYKTQKFNGFPDFLDEFHINSVFKDKSGLLYFGGLNGVLRFNPNTISNKEKQPKILFTNFKLSNKELPIGKDEILQENIIFQNKVTLKHYQDVITFEFAALQFPFSNNQEYSINMEGFDEDWRSIGNDRTITYTNLSHGDYMFKVRSREKGMDWSSNYTSKQIKILKPFWLEWWAFLIYGIITITLLYLFRKYTIAWERLKANLKLEKLTHEKDTELHNFKQQFFTNISHEIRTPVTLILSSVKRLIKTEMVPESKELKSINIIKNNSNHLLGLVNELLDFRSLEHKEIKLKVTQYDWVKFSNEIYLSFTEKGIEKNIDYSFETLLPSSNLWFDKNQMEKVLYNLLSNAFKFTSNGGAIKLILTEKDNYVLLTLTDTGVGISKNQLNKVFNRFYQIDNSTDIKESGFGLGLSISQEIVQLHHGEIIVQSKKGKGSTFVVKLLKGSEHFNSESIITKDRRDSELIKNYFDEYNSKEDITVLADISEIKNQTLLIVEDNNDIRNYLVDLLSNECKILQAPNGKEALKLVLKEMPDLIISDVMMPVMDGIEFTRIIKTDIKTSHIPVILLTARASFTHQIEGFDTGADDYITKPFNEAILRVRIKNLLQNRAVLRNKFKADGLILPNELAINRTDQDFLEKLTNVIQGNLDSDDLNANYFATELAMSHSVIYKKIKALTGLSLVEFVRDYKLKIAKKLIEEQSYSVTDACYKVGYSDRKYFSKLFKNRFGKNPSEFLSNK